MEAGAFAGSGEQTDADEGHSDMDTSEDAPEQAALSSQKGNSSKVETHVQDAPSVVTARTPVVLLRRCDSASHSAESLTKVQSDVPKTMTRGPGSTSASTEAPQPEPQGTSLTSKHTPHVAGSAKATSPETGHAASKSRTACPKAGCEASNTRSRSLENTRNRTPVADTASNSPDTPRTGIKDIHTRSSGSLAPAEEKVNDKYPICDGIAFKDGHITKYKSFSEYRCSKCDKTFVTKQHINRHIKNPRCDVDEEFIRSRKPNPVAKVKPAESDEDWTPGSELATTSKCGSVSSDDGGDSDKEGVRAGMKPRKRKQKRYRTNREFTIEDFWAGKFQIPNGSYCNSRYFTHYTCQKCMTVMVKRADFLEHCRTAHPEGTESKTSSGDGTVRQVVDPKSVEILTKIKERYLHCCPHCNRIFANGEQLKMHVRSHDYIVDGKGIHTCKICGETFEKLVYLLSHRSIRKEKQNCSECGLRFTSKCQIQGHMKAHREEKRNACQSCGESLIGFSKKEVREHMKAHKESSPLSLCPNCGKGFASKAKLDAHMLVHSEERPFSCGACNRTFKRKMCLKIHEVLHGEKTLQCDCCGEKFFYRTALASHKRKHLGIYFRCNECGKRLRSKNNLRHHIRTVHRKIKPFPCSFCLLSFSTPDGLKNHLPTHTGEKAFQCPHCSAKFAKRDYLRKHVRTHTGEKPYKCEDCGLSFACLSSLKYHRKKHHSDKTYPCTLCSMVFSLQSSLDYHRQLLHADDFPLESNGTGSWVVGSDRETGERSATESSSCVTRVEMDGSRLDLEDNQAAATLGCMSDADPELGQLDLSGVDQILNRS